MPTLSNYYDVALGIMISPPPTTKKVSNAVE